MGDKPVKKKICGYAFVIRMNDVPVVCMVQARSMKEAIDKIVDSGREYLDVQQVHAATLIPGHRDDLFPEAAEMGLEALSTLEEWRGLWN